MSNFLENTIFYIINNDYKHVRTWHSDAKTLNSYIEDASKYLDNATNELIEDDIVIQFIYGESELDDLEHDKVWDMVYDPLFNVLHLIHPKYDYYDIESVMELYLEYLKDKYHKIIQKDIEEYIPSVVSKLASKYV